MNANHDLSRFVSAQEGRYEMAYAELANGRKRSHWMWYIFPQLSGLGSSPMARRHALSGLEEAKAFLAHPLLGTRLVHISALLLGLETNNPTEIFLACPEEPVFQQVLDRFFGGGKDPLTLRLLRTG